MVGVAASKECPVLLIQTFNPILRIWHHYQKGHLPTAGGVLDQPAVTMDGIELIGAVMSEIDTERQESGIDERE